MARKERSKAAYFLVDLTELDEDVRKELIEDAQAGGGEYGLRVVEVVHNGPAQSPIYGVYYVDEDVWKAAKEYFDIKSSEVSDAEVGTDASLQADPRVEADLHRRAAEEAQAAADLVAAGEAKNLAEIVGTTDDAAAKPKARR